MYYSEYDKCKECKEGVYRIISLNDDFAGRMTCTVCKDVVHLNEKY